MCIEFSLPGSFKMNVDTCNRAQQAFLMSLKCSFENAPWPFGWLFSPSFLLAVVAILQM